MGTVEPADGPKLSPMGKLCDLLRRRYVLTIEPPMHGRGVHITLRMPNGGQRHASGATLGEAVEAAWLRWGT